MPGSQVDEVRTQCCEQGIGSYEQGLPTKSLEAGERFLNLGPIARGHYLDLYPLRRARCQHFLYRRFGGWVVWICEIDDLLGGWNKVMQHLEPFCIQRVRNARNT